MTMNFNFRFKKYLKYFFLGVLCYLLFKGISAKALVYNNGYLNINTSPFDNASEMLSSGSESDLIDTINNINSSSNIEEYITDLHQSVYITTGYNSFEDFSNDNYYAIVYYFYNNQIYNTFVYYTNKLNGEFNFNLTASSQSTQNIGYNTEVRFDFAPSMYSSDFAGGSLNKLTYGGFYFSSGYGGSLTAPTLGYGPVITTYCRNQYRPDCTTTWDGNSTTLTAPIGNFFNNTNRKFFYDSNMDLGLYLDSYTYRYTSNSDTNRYFNSYSFNSDYAYPYILTDFIDNLWSNDTYDIEEVLVREFNDNSYGITIGTISNDVYSYDSSFTDSGVLCPIQPNYSGISKDFLNDVCYITNEDFVNYDSNFVDFYNGVMFMFPNSNNIVQLDTNKYYILTLRTYSNYPLEIHSLFFTLHNYSTNSPIPAIINDVSFHNFSFYYDYQIVFSFDSAFSDLDVSGPIKNVFVNFKDMSNYTSSLSDTYSFGVSKSIKIHEFDSLPSATSISNDYSKNSLSSFSNSINGNFFTNFSVNDFGLNNIILLPLNYIRNFGNYSCSPISLPIPHLSNFSLPCVSSFMSTNFNSIWSLYKLVINGFLVYRACIVIFGVIKNIYKPDNDRIEVVDL